MICTHCHETYSAEEGGQVCNDCFSRMPVVMSIEQVRELTSDVVRQTFQGLGLDISNPLEVQRDFAMLRDFRLAMVNFRRKGIMVMAGLLAAALLAALFAGVKEQLRQAIGH